MVELFIDESEVWEEVKAVEPESCDDREPRLIAALLKPGSLPPLLVEYPTGVVWLLDSCGCAIKASPPVDMKAVGCGTSDGDFSGTWESVVVMVSRGVVSSGARERFVILSLKQEALSIDGKGSTRHLTHVMIGC